MKGSAKFDYEIKKLEYLQRKGKISKTAHRKVVIDMAANVQAYNNALTAERDKKANTHIKDKNDDLARDFFNKEVRGRVSVVI